jgi:hypothetical protein
MLFLKEFIGIVGVAALLACPLAYWIASEWLNGYAYRINLSSVPFLVSIGLVAVLTVILITLQTIRAAVANPAKSLRTE